MPQPRAHTLQQKSPRASTKILCASTKTRHSQKKRKMYIATHTYAKIIRNDQQCNTTILSPYYLHDQVSFLALCYNLVYGDFVHLTISECISLVPYNDDIMLNDKTLGQRTSKHPRAFVKTQQQYMKPIKILRI